MIDLLITDSIGYQNSVINQQLFVRVINDLTGCYSISTLNLQVSTTTANDASLVICDDDGIEDGFKEFDLTQATPDILSGIANPNVSVSFYETNQDALSELNPITTYINTIPETQGQDIVYARVEDNQNQCFGINRISLFVNPVPNIEESEEFFLCIGESIIIDSGLQSGIDISNFDYLWSTGETSESINVSIADNYTVTVTDQITGCSKERIVVVNPSEPATITRIEINDAIDNNNVTINVTGSGDYQYAIVFNDNTTITYQDSPIFNNVPSGFHTVYVQDKNGCGPDTTQDISVIGFPKFFTPNGDGFNDTWNVDGISANMIGNSIIFIFDRFGRLLKQLSPSEDGWDGTFDGTFMPSNDYWYRVELDDGRVKKGNFSLTR